MQPREAAEKVEGVKEVGECKFTSGVEERVYADGSKADHCCNRLTFTLVAKTGSKLETADFEAAFKDTGYDVISLDEVAAEAPKDEKQPG